MSRRNAAFRSAELLEGEAIVLSAKELRQRCQERPIVRGRAGKQSHGGMKLHVIRRTEDLLDRALLHLVHQMRAFPQPRSQRRVLQIRSRLSQAGDAVLMSHSAAAQAPMLLKNEPHPMRSLAAGTQHRTHCL